MILGTTSALLALMAIGIPVAVVIGIIAIFLFEIAAPVPIGAMAGELTWNAMASETLVAVPFFILLGEIMLRSGIAEKMYAAMVQWLSWMPGGTMHANIGASALFAASSGSSVATAATIGTVSVREIDRHGYDERLFLGTIAAGGTLGILIPPSVALIVYGVLTETSIPRLYLASLLPGILLSLIFMAFIALACLARPAKGGTPVSSNWGARLRGLPDLLPPIVIFACVIVTIYAGIATPTEAAAFGVLTALVLAALKRRLSLDMLREAIEGTMKTTAMIMAIVVASLLLNFALAFLGISRSISDAILALDAGPITIMLVIVAVYLILGCFMESYSIIILTVPIVAPIVEALGFDLIWFGVILVLLLEAALITPPVGLNLYVVQAVRGRGGIADVIRGSLPFVALLFIMIMLLMVAPNMALWLPELVYGQ